MNKILKLDKNNNFQIDGLPNKLNVKAIIIKLNKDQREGLFNQPLDIACRKTPFNPKGTIVYCPENCIPYIYNINNWYSLSGKNYVYKGFPVEGLITDSDSMIKLNGEEDRLEFLSSSYTWINKSEFVKRCLKCYPKRSESTFKRIFDKSAPYSARKAKIFDSRGRLRKTILKIEDEVYSTLDAYLRGDDEYIDSPKYNLAQDQFENETKNEKENYYYKSIERASNMVKAPILACFDYDYKKNKLTPDKHCYSPYIIGKKLNMPNAWRGNFYA